jgi:hypothetical protein
MGVIKFLAFSKSGQKEACDFEVALSDPHTFSPAQIDANGDFFVSITPLTGGLAPLGVRAKPKPSKFWQVEGHFSVDDKGTVRRLKSPPGSFFIRGTMQGSGNFVAVITAQLSIFRDITDQALSELLAVPALRQGASPPAPDEESAWPPTSWHGPTINTFTSVSSRILRPGSVTSGSKTFTSVLEGVTLPYQPATTERVLERIGGTLPQRFVVAWPDSLIRNANSTPTQYLTFFTHLLNQNKEGFKPDLDLYPTAWGYLWLAIWRYLNYSGDIANSPIGAHFSRGLLEQLVTSGKKIALVLPVGDANKATTSEVGDCVDASKLQDLLLEIDAFMFREAGLENGPNATLGTCGLASFSSGNNEVASFLTSTSNKSTTFYKDTLLEVYSFDNPHASVPGYVAAGAVPWLNSGSKTTSKALRLYGTDYPTYASVLPTILPNEVAPTPEQPFVTASTSFPNRTIAVLPEPCWDGDFGVSDGQGVHQLICATMLLDALRRSTNFV